jgi:hypothetical protein
METRVRKTGNRRPRLWRPARRKVQEVYLWGSEEPDAFLDITDTYRVAEAWPSSL